MSLPVPARSPPPQLTSQPAAASAAGLSPTGARFALHSALAAQHLANLESLLARDTSAAPASSTPSSLLPTVTARPTSALPVVRPPRQSLTASWTPASALRALRSYTPPAAHRQPPGSLLASIPPTPSPSPEPPLRPPPPAGVASVSSATGIRSTPSPTVPSASRPPRPQSAPSRASLPSVERSATRWYVVPRAGAAAPPRQRLVPTSSLPRFPPAFTPRGPDFFDSAGARLPHPSDRSSGLRSSLESTPQTLSYTSVISTSLRGAVPFSAAGPPQHPSAPLLSSEAEMSRRMHALSTGPYGGPGSLAASLLSPPALRPNAPSGQMPALDAMGHHLLDGLSARLRGGRAMSAPPRTSFSLFSSGRGNLTV